MSATTNSQTVYELQLRVDELRKRLRALDEEQLGSGKDMEENAREAFESSKQEYKRSVAKVLEQSIEQEKTVLSEAKVHINLIQKGRDTNGKFPVELTGKSITWSDVLDRACILFGHIPEDTLLVQLVNGQRVLVPKWKELKPGIEVTDAEIIEKPQVRARAKGLKIRGGGVGEQSSREGRSAMTSSKNTSIQQPTRGATATLATPPPVSKSKNSDWFTIIDFFLQISLFILLAVGLIDPVNISGPVRTYEGHLSRIGQAPFPTTQSGGASFVAFESNVSTLPEAIDWLYGPLTNFLLVNGSSSSQSSSSNSAFPSDLPGWWGYTSPVQCLNTNLSSVALQPPLCLSQNFSLNNPDAKRWVLGDFNSELVGAIRLRQFRVRPYLCKHKEQSQQVNCFGAYDYDTMETLSFGPQVCGFEWRSGAELAKTRSGAPMVYGNIAAYDSSGYVLDVASPSEWINALDYLFKNNSWIGLATRAIIVEFTVRNPNTDLYASIRGLIERDLSGVVWTKFDAHALRIPTGTWDTSLDIRFATDITAMVLVVVLLGLIFIRGNTFYAQNRLWRTWDLIFCAFFIAAFIMDMLLYSYYAQWSATLHPAKSFGYTSVDAAYSYLLTANRLHAVVILLLTSRFLLQGMFSISQLSNDVFVTLLIIYGILLIILIPFISSLAILVMVLELGTPIQLVTFGNALRDIFYLVTGVTDSLTAATPRIGRQTGWSTVFYLFLITLTWVLFVPTIIAWAVFAYERANERKQMFLQQQKIRRKTSFDRKLSSLLPVRPQSQTTTIVGDTDVLTIGASGSALGERNPFAGKSALQIVLAHLASATNEFVKEVRRQITNFRRRVRPNNVEE